MTKSQRLAKLKSFLCMFAVIYLTLCVLIFPEQSLTAAKNALLLCANVLIPSLFPFFVFSSMLISLGFAEFISRPMSKLMRPLFGVSGSGALCLVLGIISGYPLGASCVCDMYREGTLSKQDAEKLLAFCNNSGPLFIIGCVGSSMYFSREIGITLYTVHILSAISVGIILGAQNRHERRPHADKVFVRCAKPLGVIIKDSVSNAVNNILLVCGFTVLFAVIISSLKPLFANNILSLFAGGFLEISTGVQNTSASTLSLSSRLTITSAIIGFAGMSVHFQVIGIVSKTDLSTKKYFIGKVMQSLVSAAYMALALRSFSKTVCAEYIYSIRPYELIDFASAFKLSMLYMASAVFVMLLFWLFEKIWLWQESVKHKK